MATIKEPDQFQHAVDSQSRKVGYDALIVIFSLFLALTSNWLGVHMIGNPELLASAHVLATASGLVAIGAFAGRIGFYGETHNFD